MKKENVIVKNQVILNRGLYRWAAPRSVFVRGLVNYRFQDLQRWLLSLLNDMRGRFQIKFVMTPVFNNSGFTLIELLVVVLIIGILAAIAVPQYQKAVEKSRLAEALHNINAIQKCFDLYKLENGLPSGRVDLKDMNCPIEANLGELTQDGVFESNHFRYFAAGCNSTFCGAEISRIPSFAYTLVMDSEKGNTCFTQESDLGRYICKSIENQGWAYVDEEF